MARSLIFPPAPLAPPKEGLVKLRQWEDTKKDYSQRGAVEASGVLCGAAGSPYYVFCDKIFDRGVRKLKAGVAPGPSVVAGPGEAALTAVGREGALVGVMVRRRGKEIEVAAVKEDGKPPDWVVSAVKGAVQEVARSGSLAALVCAAGSSDAVCVGTRTLSIRLRQLKVYSCAKGSGCRRIDLGVLKDYKYFRAPGFGVGFLDEEVPAVFIYGFGRHVKAGKAFLSINWKTLGFLYAVKSDGSAVTLLEKPFRSFSRNEAVRSYPAYLGVCAVIWRTWSDTECASDIAFERRRLYIEGRAEMVRLWDTASVPLVKRLRVPG